MTTDFDLFEFNNGFDLWNTDEQRIAFCKGVQAGLASLPFGSDEDAYQQKSFKIYREATNRLVELCGENADVGYLDPSTAQAYSDCYKDAYGIRPRGIATYREARDFLSTKKIPNAEKKNFEL
jgi:hypothetical protein